MCKFIRFPLDLQGVSKKLTEKILLLNRSCQGAPLSLEIAAIRCRSRVYSNFGIYPSKEFE